MEHFDDDWELNFIKGWPAIFPLKHFQFPNTDANRKRWTWYLK